MLVEYKCLLSTNAPSFMVTGLSLIFSKCLTGCGQCVRLFFIAGFPTACKLQCVVLYRLILWHVCCVSYVRVILGSSCKGSVVHCDACNCFLVLLLTVSWSFLYRLVLLLVSASNSPKSQPSTTGNGPNSTAIKPDS